MLFYATSKIANITLRAATAVLKALKFPVGKAKVQLVAKIIPRNKRENLNGVAMRNPVFIYYSGKFKLKS